jgi:hypothetical protein
VPGCSLTIGSLARARRVGAGHPQSFVAEYEPELLKKFNISTVMAGQRLGIKEVYDAIWLVSFMHYDLGYIDLEQRTLQTIDNPFGTRLSPMS